jgi:hypothetical protein
MTMFHKLAVASVLLLVTTPALADQTWLQRRNELTQCENIRTETLTAVDKWNGKLWFASTDNSRTGYMNPNVVIEARQRVQEMVQAYDWKYTARIRNADTLDSTACRDHALEYARKIGEFIESTLRRTGTR